MKTPAADITISPADENEDPLPKSSSSWKARWTKQGWKTTVGLGFFAALLVCLVNLVLLIWAMASPHDARSQILNAYPSDNAKGITTVYTGSCDSTGLASTWAHLAINILSSLLLAASNNAMQVLAAPSRQEVDEAHARRLWLDVGVQSWRNLSNIAVARRLLWMLLALTTIPLHLLYNSVLLEATSVNDYAAVTVDRTFLDGRSWNSTRSQCFQNMYYYGSANAAIEYLQRQQGLVRLENADCMSVYGRNMFVDYGNVLVVANTSVSRGQDPVLYASYVKGMSDIDNRWICQTTTGRGDDCDVAKEIRSADQWQQFGTPTPGGFSTYGDPDYFSSHCYMDYDKAYNVYPIEYCLAQPTADNCSIGVAVGILTTVAICNVVKVVCLWLTWRMERLDTLVTIGDAVSSFLTRPDLTTKSYGPLETRSQSWKLGNIVPIRWEGQSRIGFAAASAARWCTSSLLFVMFWLLCGALLVLGLRSYANTPGMSITPSFILDRGFGRLHLDSIVNTPSLRRSSFAPLVLLANLPQLLISLLYVLYNDLITRQSACREWSAFARGPKCLRVSRPRGSQHGTHFLSLPLKLAIPLITTMTILHWLVSRSIFLVYITGFDYAMGGARPVPLGAIMLALGWSPLALIISLIVGGLLILVLWISGLAFRYGTGIPLTRGCSVAISAACHPPEWDSDAAEKPIRYGVVSDLGEEGVQIRHVSFSSGTVQPLRRGEEYQ